MMNRVLEPELMLSKKQVMAYSKADFMQSDQYFVQMIQSRISNQTPKKIIDLGCGPGNISFLLAITFPHAEVVAIDGSLTMIEMAEEIHTNQYTSIKNLKFIKSKIPISGSLINEMGNFDLIVSNSLLHHLHNPEVLWQDILKLAKNNAYLYLGDLVRPDSKQSALNLLDQYASDADEILKEDFYNSLLAAFSVDEVKIQLKQRPQLVKVKVNKVTDRHLHIYGPIIN